MTQTKQLRKKKRKSYNHNIKAEDRDVVKKLLRSRPTKEQEVKFIDWYSNLYKDSGRSIKVTGSEEDWAEEAEEGRVPEQDLDDMEAEYDGDTTGYGKSSEYGDTADDLPDSEESSVGEHG